VDRARADRVLQHVADPAQALAELRRVLRPGGVVGMAEPGWETLVIDDIDVITSRAMARSMAGQVRNNVIGRQLARLATEAQFAVRTVDASVVMFRDFDAAEQILGLRRNAVRAVHGGAVDQTAAGSWLDRLASGSFLACFTFFAVTASARGVNRARSRRATAGRTGRTLGPELPAGGHDPPLATVARNAVTRMKAAGCGAMLALGTRPFVLPSPVDKIVRVHPGCGVGRSPLATGRSEMAR